MVRRKKASSEDNQEEEKSYQERQEERRQQQKQKESEQSTIASFFSENWKHGNAVKRAKQSKKSLSVGVLGTELLACILLCTMASQNSTWEMVVPAITSSVYVAAGINNVNESQVQTFFGFFDSTFMSMMNAMFLASMIFMGPGGLMFLLASIPFFFDGVTSFFGHRQSSQTITDNTNVPLIMSEEWESTNNNNVEPSENLPEIIRSNSFLNNLLTCQWKDGAFESQEPLSKQLIALALIFLQGYLGGMVAYDTSNTALGIFTLIYSIFGLLGYFDFAGAPLARMARVNAAPLVLGGTTVALVGTQNASGALPMALMVSMMADLIFSFKDWGKDTSQQQQQSESQEEQTPAIPQGPVANFFLRSWKNGVYKKGSETVALLMVFVMFLQTLLCIFSFTDSSTSLPLNIGMMTFVMASMYAFFGYKTDLAAINLLQSNAAQASLIGVGGVSALTGGAGLPFVALLGVMTLDFFASMTVYFGQNQSMLTSSITSSERMPLTDSKGDDHFSSQR